MSFPIVFGFHQDLGALDDQVFVTCYQRRQAVGYRRPELGACRFGHDQRQGQELRVALPFH
ncbi:hypothetical protein D9M68_988210 [compost metagenome]